MREIGLWGEFYWQVRLLFCISLHIIAYIHIGLYSTLRHETTSWRSFWRRKKAKRKNEMKGCMKWKPAHLDVDSRRRLRRYVSSVFWTRWMDFFPFMEFTAKALVLMREAEMRVLCFFQSARGCGPKSCNDRFSPVFSCARGPAIRAPFPRDRPVLIPPSPARARSRWGARTAPERLTSRGRTWERARRCESRAR